MSPTVTVSGTAAVAARPDRAHVHLGISVLADEPAAALGQVAERTTRLEALLAELGIPEADRVSGGVTVAEETEWRNDRSVILGHRATARVTARVTELAVLGRLLSTAVEQTGARVDGPFWIVDAANPARLAACRDAVTSARARAAAYAAGLGLELGEVEEVNETVPHVMPGPMVGFRAAAMTAPDVPMSPGELDVSSTVWVRFALRTP
jgi:uncharacterized protein